jgi:hypothetical protein
VHSYPRGRHPLPPLAASSAIGEEVLLADALVREGREQRILAAAGEAVQEDATVLGLAEAEVGVFLSSWAGQKARYSPCLSGPAATSSFSRTRSTVLTPPQRGVVGVEQLDGRVLAPGPTL